MTARHPILALAVASAAACARDATLYSQDGVVRARGCRDRLDGDERGAWIYRFPSGELREEGTYDDGHRVGTWTQRYPSGQKRSSGERRWDPALGASVREGPWTFWHDNGFVSAQGLYRGGLREGRWEFTNRDGSLDGAASGEYHAGVKLDGER
jgi:antitoxin component YwqK of YwqJK toxin-antitoxin module